MSLLTAQDVTAWVPQAAANEDLIESAIEQAEGLANGYCRRRLEEADHDERYDVQRGETDLLLRQWPVSKVTAVTVDPDNTATELTETTDFLVEEDAGILVRTSGYWEAGRRWIRVQYTAGYTAEDLNSPELMDQKVALLELVAWRMGFRGGAGVTTESMDGVTTTREATVRGIPAAIAGMLERFERTV